MTHDRSAVRVVPAHVHALGVVGVLALAGVGYALGYAPAARAQQRAELQQRAIAKAKDEASATAQHIDTARRELEALRASAHTLPVDTDPVDVLTDALSAHALAAHSVAADTTVRLEGLTRTALVIHASGSFSDISGFIAELHRAHAGAAIDGFTIAPDPMGGDSLVFQASLSVYTPQTLPPGATADGPTGRAPAATPPVR